MRNALLLLAAMVPGWWFGACATAGGGVGDDDDDDSSGGATSTGGAGGMTTTTTETTTDTTTDTTTTDTTTTTTSTTTTSGSSCYAGHGDCDPLQSGSCTTPGAACDIEAESNEFFCFDPPNTATFGAPCSNEVGPYCMNGLKCVDVDGSSVCLAFCCTESDCASCTSLGMVGSIDLKVCAP